MADRIQTQIDIAVKGATQIRKVSKALDQLFGDITQVNNKAGDLVNSFSNLNSLLSMVKKNFNNAASGTIQQERAARLLVTTERQLNKEYEKRQTLLNSLRNAPLPLPGSGVGSDPVAKSIARRRRKLSRGTNQYSSPIGPFQASEILGGQSSPVDQKIQRTINLRKDETVLQQALLALEIKSAKTLNEKLQIQGELNRKTAEAVNNAKLRGQFSPLTSDIRGNIGDIKSRRESNILSSRRNQFGNVFTGRSGRDFGQIGGRIGPVEPVRSAGGFSAFSARADEIQKLTQAEIALSKSRSLASEKIKSLASIERRRAKTESFGANFRRFRRNRPGDRGVRQQVFQSAAIGGGFPLLFGGGPLQAAAGALGGGIGGLFGKGGGFAGSIAATAVVQTIQQTVAAISELGQALGPFTQNTESIVNSLGLQNSVQQAQIQLIEQVEGKTAAFNAAMKLMANDIGQRGVNALKEFGESSRILGSQFTLLITKLQALAAGAANFVLRITGLEDRLKKADATRVVGAAAVRGNSQALGLIQRQKQIDEMDSRGGEGKRKKSLQDQLDIEKQIFAIREQQKTKLGEITLEYDQAVQKNKEELELKEAVKKLTETGMSEAIAKEVAQREQLRDKVLKEVDALADALRLERAKLGNTDTELERLKEIDAVLEDILKKRKEINGETDKAVGKIKSTGDEIKKVKVTKEEISGLLANEMTNALMGLVEGTRTLGESLASVAKSLAKMFLNAGFQNMFNSMFNITKGEQGLYNRAGSFKAFQYGGVVSSPTLGMIGEGGEPEYVIPSSKMSGAMARYSAGARGGAVIPGGSGASGTVAGSSGNTIVEYTGPVLNFNGDEYVPKSAVPEIINTAARQGGEAGKTKAISALRNSRSQRASLGL